MSYNKPLCIYHANCVDGFTAAWAVNRAFGGLVDFHPASYGDDPPDVTGRHVIIVDFSYKLPVIEGIAAQCASLLILDHHKTAQEDLGGMPAPSGSGLNPPAGSWQDHMECAIRFKHAHPINRVGVVFDMEKSGARLAWEFFHGHNPPMLVQYVEDRDLWRFHMSDTRAVHAALTTHQFDFGVWDALDEALREPFSRSDLISEGRAVLRQDAMRVNELIQSCKRSMVICMSDVPVANVPYFFASEVGGKLAQGHPFAATYWDDETYRNFSLRSRDGGADVSEIAKTYGGGGHKGAAGFRVRLQDLFKLGLL